MLTMNSIIYEVGWEVFTKRKVFLNDNVCVCVCVCTHMGFPGGTLLMQEMQEMWVQSQDQDDPPEQEVATCPKIFTWKIPWTVEYGMLSP